MIGYRPVFESLKSNDLMQYYNQQYVPENMVIVVGGNVSENTVLNQIKTTFGAQHKMASPTRYLGGHSTILSTATIPIVMPSLATPRVVLRYPTVSFHHDDVYPLDLLAYIFGNGEQSMLYQEFVVRQKIATSISVHSITPTNDYGYFEISVESTVPYHEIEKKFKHILI